MKYVDNNNFKLAHFCAAGVYWQFVLLQVDSGGDKHFATIITSNEEEEKEEEKSYIAQTFLI